MITINKVTTKSGDKGLTLGPNCKRIKKNSEEIEFLGNLDELNVTLGEVQLTIQNQSIQQIQNDLFDIGASFFKQIDIEDSYIKLLDKIIEEYKQKSETLSSFLIPKGSIKTVILHKARVITRKVERKFYNIKNYENFQNIGIYLNRLSDVFFTFLRNKNEEELWQNSINEK